MAFNENGFHDDELDLDELRRLAGDDVPHAEQSETDELSELKKLIGESEEQVLSVDEPTRQIPTGEEFDFTKLTQPAHQAQAARQDRTGEQPQKREESKKQKK